MVAAHTNTNAKAYQLSLYLRSCPVVKQRTRSKLTRLVLCEAVTHTQHTVFIMPVMHVGAPCS